MRKTTGVLIGLGSLVSAVVLFSVSGGMASGTQPASRPFDSTTTAPDFTGTLLAVSDADMEAKGYVTGEVGRPAGQRDTLTVFPFSGSDRTASGTITASNSVMGWPQIVEPSSDGRYVYVIETRDEFPDGVTAYEDLYNQSPAGSRLSVFDISDPLSPVLAAEVEAGVNPLSVSVTPDDRYLATSSDEAGAEIVLFRLQNGVPTERFAFAYPHPLPEVGALADGIRALIFHPSGDYLAASISDHQIAFMAIDYDAEGDPVGVRAHGNTIDDFMADSGTAIAAGAFSDNGRYFLVPDVGWGHQTPRDFLFSKRGRLISVAFDPDGAHQVADVEPVGWSAEGIALSNDNTLIATVNMERTSVAGTMPGGVVARRRAFSSLSLVRFDDRTGQLDKVDEKRFRGILPEDAVFDADDDMLAVTIYQMNEFEPESGFVEFWRIDRSGDSPQLVRTGLALPTTRGVHDLALVP